MPWLKVSVETDGASAEALSERMLVQGASSVSLDACSTPNEVLEPPPGVTPLWPRVTVTALFPPTAEIDSLRLALGAHEVARLGWLGDADWSTSLSDELPELRFGDRLAVAPRDAPPSPFAGVLVRLSPGLAFGTGHHPTTRSCLAWLAETDLRGLSVLDYGCGSGILGIAAARLGAARVVAVDVEPQARWATQANADFNGVQLDAVLSPERFRPRSEFDLVFANILANTLVDLGPTLNGCLNSGGRLVMAGLLKSQIAAVMGGYPCLIFDPPAINGEWARLTGRRCG